MIDPAFCRAMARYNLWQNTNVVEAADSLDEAARNLDRGAFFGSIRGTLNHLLWADRSWMSRFDGWTRPKGGIPTSSENANDWNTFKHDRVVDDTRILDWALRVYVGDMDGPLTWYSGLMQSDVSRPKWICVQHFFNHQTHHRGQIHAMLTAAGARPGDTDLFLMPEGD